MVITHHRPLRPMFPISRDPPEGGTAREGYEKGGMSRVGFPISRDPPEGGTSIVPVVR